MKTLARILFFLVPSFVFADVVSFGPITNFNQVSMPSGYGGFNWGTNAWDVIPNGLFEADYANTYGAPSGAAAFPTGGSGGDVTSATPFTFEGVHLTSWGQNDTYAFFPSATTITVYGFDAHNNLVGQATTGLVASAYTFLPANFPNVSLLQFTANGDFLMDDLTFVSGSSTSSAPEPSAFTLLVAGGGALLGLLLKRQWSLR